MAMPMMGPEDALVARLEAPPEQSEEAAKPGFEMAADQAFKANAAGDMAGFRSALRSAIKIIINDMKL